MDENRHEYLKSLIQVALLGEYARTENKEYKNLYEAWYGKYSEIDISNLD